MAGKMSGKANMQRRTTARPGGTGKRTTAGKTGVRSRTAVRRPHAMDYSIVFLVIFLVGFGLVMVYSTSSYRGSLYMNDAAYWLKRQAVFAVIGVVAMFLVARIDYHFWRSRKWMLPVY